MAKDSSISADTLVASVKAVAEMLDEPHTITAVAAHPAVTVTLIGGPVVVEAEE